jgi:hypothetical protein
MGDNQKLQSPNHIRIYKKVNILLRLARASVGAAHLRKWDHVTPL